jgi:hypothetical protein
VTRGHLLQLAWADYEGRNCLKVSGWAGAEFRELGYLSAPDLNRRMAVIPEALVDADAHVRAIQPIAGRFAIEEDALYFVPLFPFMEGTGYSLLLYPGSEQGRGVYREVWTVQFPTSAQGDTTGVVAVYPSADVVPVNLLKLYVHFSGPMSEGWATRAVHVRSGDNYEPLHGVFLANRFELWGPERKRLTLMLDPGRIKRGLVPNQEGGYPLIEGVPIVVSISTEFRDAAGAPLRAGVERRYRVGPPVRALVNPQDWRCHVPAAGSLAPLKVEFDRSLDHALLQHCLWITDADGAPVAGRGYVGAGEQSWCFQPDMGWRKGRYVLVVDSRLEDMAGNSVNRVFDRDRMRAEDTPVGGRYVSIELTCTTYP